LKSIRLLAAQRARRKTVVPRASNFTAPQSQRRMWMQTSLRCFSIHEISGPSSVGGPPGSGSSRKMRVSKSQPISTIWALARSIAWRAWRK
jgi:hypothetical protein